MLPRARTTGHMNMQMMNFLAPFDSGIGHQTESPLRIRVAALLQGQFWGQYHQAPHHAGVFISELGHGRNVHFGNQKKCTGAHGLMS